MTFVPRIHENGNVCCSDAKHLCDKCKAYLALTRTAALRTAIPAHDYSPPDPYEQQLAPMRAEVESHKPTIPAPVCPMADKHYTPGNGSAPNGYAIALDRLKKGQQ